VCCIQYPEWNWLLQEKYWARWNDLPSFQSVKRSLYDEYKENTKNLTCASTCIRNGVIRAIYEEDYIDIPVYDWWNS
jgi:hypothetical protein